MIIVNDILFSNIDIILPFQFLLKKVEYNILSGI